jgi:hypothetical protein
VAADSQFIDYSTLMQAGMINQNAPSVFFGPDSEFHIPTSNSTKTPPSAVVLAQMSMAYVTAPSRSGP